MLRRTSASISPTALYTGTVWRRHGLSHPAFATLTGTAMWTGLLGPRTAVELLGGPRLDAMLLARHHVIDRLLEDAIVSGEVSQVVELASGISPRGWRFTARHGDALTYVETDLPDMARRKREVLADAGLATAQHHVRAVDAFAKNGPTSLRAVAAELDPARGTAVITEGLINYFPMSSVRRLWATVADVLDGFPRGLYLSDLHLDRHGDPATAAAMAVLSGFVRGRVHLHFADESAAVDALISTGFGAAELIAPSSLAGEIAVCGERGVDRNLIVRATSGAP